MRRTRENQGIYIVSTVRRKVLLSQKGERHSKEKRPIFRYVDDTFAVFRNKEESGKLFQPTKLSPSFSQITFEKEKNNCLPFLDVNVERTVTSFETSVYRKPTFTG